MPLPLAFRILKQCIPSYCNFMRNLMLRTEKVKFLMPARGGTCLLERISHNLSDYISWEKGVKIVGQWWAGCLLHQDCFAMHASCPPFEPKPPFSPHSGCKTYSRGNWTSFFIFLFTIWPHWINLSMLFCCLCGLLRVQGGSFLITCVKRAP